MSEAKVMPAFGRAIKQDASAETHNGMRPTTKRRYYNLHRGGLGFDGLGGALEKTIDQNNKMLVNLSTPRPLFHLAAQFFALNPFEPWTTPDKVERFHTTEYPGLPGLDDLGIRPSTVEQKAIEILRLHRRFRFLEADLDATKPAKNINY